MTSHTPPDVEATGPITHISVNAAFACCAVRGSSKVHVFRRRPATPEEAYDQAGTGPEEPAAELSMTRGSRREGSMGRTSRREGSKREVQSTQEGPEEVGPSAEALDPVAAAKVPSEITHLSMGGPECASLLAVCRGGDVVTCDVSAPDVSFESLLRYHPGKVLAFLPVSADVVVSADSTGRVISWDLSTGTATAVLQCRATVTAATACHKERIIALGSSLGHLRVVRASEDGSLELVFRSRLHREAIAHVCTSPSGTSIATVSSSHRLYFTVLSGARWRPLGFVFPPDGVVSMCWPAAGAVAAPLLLLTSAEEVVWVQAPGEDAVAGKDHKLLAKYAPMKRMRLEHQIITAAGIPSKDMPSMLGMTNDRALHLYTIPKELQNWTTGEQSLCATRRLLRLRADSQLSLSLSRDLVTPSEYTRVYHGHARQVSCLALPTRVSRRFPTASPEPLRSERKRRPRARAGEGSDGPRGARDGRHPGPRPAALTHSISGRVSATLGPRARLHARGA